MTTPMDIRQADFWPDIEGIFPREAQETLPVTDTGRGSRLCRYYQFVDRLETAARRARRTRRYALLVMLQFAAEKGRQDDSRSGSWHELLLCRVSSCLRSSDSLCDLGGARFAILLDDISESSAVPMIIEKLNATLKGPAGTAGKVGWFDAYLGASLFPVDGIPVSQVWLDTEASLAEAVAAGSGDYSISPMVTGQAAMERFELSKDLYRAYRNDEFEISYQPAIDFSENRLCAFEGLLRWRHPERGCLSPGTFLPLLEESGLIVPVGEKLLKQACQVASGLSNERSEPLRMCINVSARQLSDGGFLLSVFDALYEARLEPSLLQLEFPEPVLSQDRSTLQRILPELKNAGVRLAVDRFGTGDASLSELVCLPVNLIKLDQALVSRLVEDPVSQAIVSGTLALARAADMTVAAVGVEQQMQAKILQKMGCREAQGRYYFSPLPVSEIRAALSA